MPPTARMGTFRERQQVGSEARQVGCVVATRYVARRCESRPGTSTPPVPANRGCSTGSTSGGPTSSACRKPRPPMQSSPRRSAPTSPGAATRSRTTARRPVERRRACCRASGSTTSPQPSPTSPAIPTPRPARGATCGGLRVVSRLRPQRADARTTRTTPTSSTWLEALGRRLSGTAARGTVVCGDFNIAPTDDDVFDPKAFIGSTHVTPAEREALRALWRRACDDVVRSRWPSHRVFTYWDYRAGMFHQDLGMRIDLVLRERRRCGAGARQHGSIAWPARAPRPAITRPSSSTWTRRRTARSGPWCRLLRRRDGAADRHDGRGGRRAGAIAAD